MSNTITIENHFAVSRAKLWHAITVRDEMVKWYFDMIPSFEPTEGFETQFNVQCEGTDFLHLWRVTEVIPERKLVYDWKYKEIPGESYVVWELSDGTEGGAKLTFRHEGLESFPKNNPMFTPEATRAGWEYFINGTLPKYLSENPD